VYFAPFGRCSVISPNVRSPNVDSPNVNSPNGNFQNAILPNENSPNIISSNIRGAPWCRPSGRTHVLSADIPGSIPLSENKILRITHHCVAAVGKLFTLTCLGVGRAVFTKDVLSPTPRLDGRKRSMTEWAPVLGAANNGVQFTDTTRTMTV